MDENVLAAMARWPDVPDVYGWMSLSDQGRWRLHPGADAWQPGQPCRAPFTPGESIDSPQICRFIERNYASDNRGRWYFQNGPQRVFVRLDAAPYILHTDSLTPTLRTHNDQAVTSIESWWLDDEGRLYALTEHGPGLISGRDASIVFEALHTSNGTPLLEALEHAQASSPDGLNQFLQGDKKPQPAFYVGLPAKVQGERLATNETPLYFCKAAATASMMGFVPCPEP